MSNTLLAAHLEPMIHHAFLQLYYRKDVDQVKEIYKGLININLSKYNVHVFKIKEQARREVKSGNYERILKEIGSDTKGTETLVAYIYALIDTLND
jgi:hypothetical protein